MSLPIDRTAKATLDANLVNGITSDAPAVKGSNDVVYNTVDELFNYTSGLVAGGVLQPYPAFLSRQALINGNFDVAQRGTSFLNPANLAFTADRWKVEFNTGGGTFPNITHSRQNHTPGDIFGAYNYYRKTFDGAGASLGASSYDQIEQYIENGQRYLCGAGKKVTVSFWARSNIANKRIGVYIRQNYGTGGTPSTAETISGANYTLTSTWQKFSVTFPTNTLVGKTFGTNNDDYLAVFFMDMWGSSNQAVVGASTPETFVGAGNVDVSEAQINVGDQALPFQPKSYNQEEEDAKRYCNVFQDNVSANYTVGFGNAISPTAAIIHIDLGKTMRTIPTLVANAGDWALADGVNVPIVLTSISIITDQSENKAVSIQCIVASGLTQYRPYRLISNGTNKKMIFDSEI